MKRIIFTILTFIFSLSHVFGQTLPGAWNHQVGEELITIIATEKYLTISSYNLSGKEFKETWGGLYTLGVNNQVMIEVEFHSNNPSIVNSTQTYSLDLKKKNIDFDGKKFSKVDSKANALTGLWRITGRANPEGVISAMQQGPRKTLKIMSGGYFQWFAINTQTREFSGSGGGQYSLKDGKYTEVIHFFSRDNSRVGAELSFDADVSANEWTHSGKSSKGDPIKEIWTKQ